MAGGSGVNSVFGWLLMILVVGLWVLALLLAVRLAWLVYWSGEGSGD